MSLRNLLAYLAVVVLLWIVIGMPPKAHACDCTFYAVEALERARIKLKTIPSIAVNDWHKHAGAYSEGVVHLRRTDDCRTMLHELVHHHQFEKKGNAKTSQEWYARERDAAVITMNVYGGGC